MACPLHRCWDLNDSSPYWWIIKGPIVLSVGVSSWGQCPLALVSQPPWVHRGALHGRKEDSSCEALSGPQSFRANLWGGLDQHSGPFWLRLWTNLVPGCSSPATAVRGWAGRRGERCG